MAADGIFASKVTGLVPLDAQVDIWPPRTVPETLESLLFGSLEGDTPWTTYALLDTGKLQWGESEFEDCELRHQCLFNGVAAKELKDAAPYLFELKPDKDFTRRLFTRDPEMPCEMTSVHLWHTQPAIFIRSRAGFEQVWKHLRRFTRLPRPPETWIYFRFWEACVMPALSHGPAAWLGRQMLDDGTPDGQMWVSITGNTAHVFQLAPDHLAETRRLELTNEVVEALDAEVLHRQEGRDMETVRNGLAEPDRGQVSDTFMRDTLSDLRDAGFSEPEQRQKALGLFVQASLQGIRDRAAEILWHEAQGPTVRLWHLEKLVEADEK